MGSTANIHFLLSGMLNRNERKILLFLFSIFVPLLTNVSISNAGSNGNYLRALSFGQAPITILPQKKMAVKLPFGLILFGPPYIS